MSTAATAQKNDDEEQKEAVIVEFAKSISSMNRVRDRCAKGRKQQT